MNAATFSPDLQRELGEALRAYAASAPGTEDGARLRDVTERVCIEAHASDWTPEAW